MVLHTWCPRGPFSTMLLYLIFLSRLPTPLYPGRPPIFAQTSPPPPTCPTRPPPCTCPNSPPSPFPSSLHPPSPTPTHRNCVDTARVAEVVPHPGLMVTCAYCTKTKIIRPLINRLGHGSGSTQTSLGHTNKPTRNKPTRETWRP